MSMKGKLDSQLAYLDSHMRGRVIDDVLGTLAHPTDFMIATGAHSLDRYYDRSATRRAEWCFEQMIREAQEGG